MRTFGGTSRRNWLAGLGAIAAFAVEGRAQSPPPLVGFVHGSAPTGPYPGYVSSFVAR